MKSTADSFARELHREHPMVEAHGVVPMDLWQQRRAGGLHVLRQVLR